MEKAIKTQTVVEKIIEVVDYSNPVSIQAAYLQLRYCAEPKIAHLIDLHSFKHDQSCPHAFTLGRHDEVQNSAIQRKLNEAGKHAKLATTTVHDMT
jgi:hypothetical protein